MPGRATTLVAGLSKLTREVDDFLGVGSPTCLTGGEGPDGGAGGSLSHGELNLERFISGELQVVEGGEGGGRGGPLESVSSALVQLGGSSGRGSVAAARLTASRLDEPRLFFGFGS